MVGEIRVHEEDKVSARKLEAMYVCRACTTSVCYRAVHIIYALFKWLLASYPSPACQPAASTAAPPQRPVRWALKRRKHIRCQRTYQLIAAVELLKPAHRILCAIRAVVVDHYDLKVQVAAHKVALLACPPARKPAAKVDTLGREGLEEEPDYNGDIFTFVVCW